MAEDFWWKKTAWTYAVARRSQFVQAVHEAFLARVDQLPLKPGMRALDAGCGDGNCAFPLAKRGIEVTGLDFGDAILRRARRRQQKLGVHNASFEYGDLNEPLRYENGSFDLVTSSHALMKVREVQLALREFFRVLRPGGYAVISTTSSDEEFRSWFLRYMADHGIAKAFWDVRWLVVWNVPYVIMTRRAERRDEWRWPPETLASNMEAAGFKTLATEEVPYTHVGCALGVFQKPE